MQKYYNFKENEILYIKKIDIIQEGMRIPKIEYDVFCKLFGDNLTKLNVSICTNNYIYLYIPVKDIGNLDQLNKSSDYYNDICSSATSESGADIIIKDRQKEYINKTVCQDDCDFNNYNDKSQKAKCSCKAKKSSFSFIDMNINKTKLLDNFKNVYNIANLNILVCVKKLFTKIGMIKNVGSYIMILIIIIHITDLFIFFISQFEKLEKIIKDIVYAIKNIKFIKDNNKRKDKEPKRKGKVKKVKNKQKEIKLKSKFGNEIINNNKIKSKKNIKKY